MKFSYQARDDQGRQQKGQVQAASKEAALQILDRHGLYVTGLKEAKDKPIYAKRIAFFDRVSDKEIMMFSRQLSIMFKSRVSLVDALGTIGKNTKNKAFREQIFTISEEVEGGTALSDALSRYPRTFSSFYINILKRGEALGKLSDVLEYLADHLEREHELKSKIKAAFTYPAFIVVVAFAVLTLLSVMVLPNLITILQEGGQELPIITKIVIMVSTWYQDWWWLFAGVSVVGVFGVLTASKTKKGRGVVHRLVLKIPALSAFLKMMYVSRFGENLATLSAGGVSIVQALDITGKIMGNEVYERIIQEVKDSVSEGSKIADVFEKYPKEFPAIFTQMILVGEKTGSLDVTLKEIVHFYEKEMERAIDTFLGLLEPVLIVVLGVLVGGLMASLMLPLYQSITQI